MRLLLLCSLLFLVSCHPSPVLVPVELGTQQYQTPVEHKTFDAPNGWDRNETVIFTVPASSASTTPIVIAVRKKHKTVMEKIFPAKNSQDFEAVSNSKEILQTEEPSVPWWIYAIFTTAGLSIVFAILSYLKIAIPGVSFICRLLGKK